MRTSALFENKPVFSFEVFPPRPNVPIESIYNTLDDLKDLTPDFISVTYGAGGSQPGASTAEICRRIQSEHNIPSIAHLPCINETKESVLQKLDDFRQKGIENILALRGDKNPELPPQNDFKYASDIIDFIAQNGDFDIAAACYPEGHFECDDFETSLEHLKIKQDAGADFLVTQLFFDNELFYRFREGCARWRIKTPIVCGIMPFTSVKQIQRMAFTCGATIPSKVIRKIAACGDDEAAQLKAGIEYACDQIVDLADNGVDGIHIYTMNKPEVGRAMHDALVGCGYLEG